MDATPACDIPLCSSPRCAALRRSRKDFRLRTGVTCEPEFAAFTFGIAATRATKRRLHRAPISASAAALLHTIRLRVPEDCEWVFPGEAEGRPLQDIKRFWEDVRAKAELPGVRIHDLRHTFASLLVSGGMTLPMIGKLLGHTQVQTTQRYAHLLDDPLRAGLEQVGDMLRTKPRLVERSQIKPFSESRCG